MYTESRNNSKSDAFRHPTMSSSGSSVLLQFLLNTSEW